MPNSTNNVRHLVMLALVDRIRDRIGPGIQVEARWPGDEIELDSIYIAGATGPVTTTTFGQGLGQRARRRDEFSLAMFVQGGSPSSDTVESLERAAELLAAVEDVVALDPTLGDLPGLNELSHVIDVDGPSTFPSRAGVFTIYTLTISGLATYD
jgi:hypothetical protein